MKIQYSDEERKKALDTKECADCGSVLDSKLVELGRIFCRKCLDVKFDWAKDKKICWDCVTSGVERPGIIGIDMDICKEHHTRVMDLFNKCKDALAAIGSEKKQDYII